MIFQQSAVDEWVEMSRICLGLLMKCSRHPNPEIVAMATAKLHTVLQLRATEDLHELGYLLFSINKALNATIDSKLNSDSILRLNGSSLFIFTSFFEQISHSNSFLSILISRWRFRGLFIFDARSEGFNRKISFDSQFIQHCT